MIEYWWRSLAMLLALAVFASIVAALAGASAGWWLFCAGQFAIIVFHQRQLARLLDWLNKQRSTLPTTNGHWGEIFYLVQRHYKKNRSDNQRAADDKHEMFQVAGALPEGVVILDESRRIVWLNASAQRHLGLSLKQDKGQYFNYLLREQRLLEWLARGDALETLTMPSPVTSDRSLSLQLAALPNGRRMVLSHDITELIRLDEMRRDFIANVSHELRTPITVIVGFLEAFADMKNPDPTQFKVQIGLMREQSDRIRALIDDLLTLARLESVSDLANDSIDIAALGQQILNEARSLSRGQHLLSLDMDTQGTLQGSRAEIYSACMNLVTNAIRYTPVGGDITLSWDQATSGGVQFSVRDTGVGIEAQHLPRLTERFYRVNRGRSRDSGGTGLGLAIAKRVLLRHQGRLKIESVHTKGSLFTAVFPAQRFTVAARSADATLAPAQPEK